MNGRVEKSKSEKGNDGKGKREDKVNMATRDLYNCRKKNKKRKAYV